MKLFVFFLPLLEIVGFVVVGAMIGVLPMLALVIAGSLAGFLILRKQGLRNLEARYRQGHNSSEHLKDMMNAPMMFLVGLLLLVPGFFSDLLALFLLIPRVRGLFLAWVTQAMMKKHGFGQSSPFHQSTNTADQSQHRIIEGEFSREDSKSSPEEGSKPDKDFDAHT